MMMIYMTLCLGITISSILTVMCLLISKKSNMDREKSSPFECGFNPMKSAREPLSVQFFLLAVLFLIFDVEIAIILPVIIDTKWAMTSVWITSITMFVVVLILGLYHEWKNGMLEWAK
uniref:NADH-ubiquinone oxidoreductase chain 3 n=1 Tax=Coptosoma bifarium TaxID=1589673 RepID=B7SM94_COPBI|nr:NADH dehydrogenase subunit 3 [Coptosoma bifarium]ABZ01988.1 NADH dehydrogenase subunit 3 [Coptosoma bifarium]